MAPIDDNETVENRLLRAMEAAGASVRAKQLAIKANVNYNTVRRWLSTLERHGKVVRVAKGLYDLPEAASSPSTAQVDVPGDTETDSPAFHVTWQAGAPTIQPSDFVSIGETLQASLDCGNNASFVISGNEKPHDLIESDIYSCHGMVSSCVA
jgi:hypothetical protein